MLSWFEAYVLKPVSSLDHVEKFKEYVSFKYPNINFSSVKENDDRLSFLDINIFREKGKCLGNTAKKSSVVFILVLTALCQKPIELG